MSQEDQKYANIFLHDVQNGNIFVKQGVQLQDYINEFGRFDEVKKTADTTKARTYFEAKEGIKLTPLKVNMKMDKLLRKFIFTGGCEI